MSLVSCRASVKPHPLVHSLARPLVHSLARRYFRSALPTLRPSFLNEMYVMTAVKFMLVFKKQYCILPDECHACDYAHIVMPRLSQALTSSSRAALGTSLMSDMPCPIGRSTPRSSPVPLSSTARRSVIPSYVLLSPIKRARSSHSWAGLPRRCRVPGAH